MHYIHTNQPPVQHPVVPPAGTSAAPEDRDRDSYLPMSTVHISRPPMH